MAFLLEVFTILILWMICFWQVQQTEKKYVYIFICATVFRLFLLWYRINIGLLPMSGGDFGVFINNARRIISCAQNPIELIFPTDSRVIGTDLYDRLVAIVFTTLGSQDSNMCCFSYIASEIAFIFIYKTAYLISENNITSTVAGLFFYLWPMEMIYSTDFLREMPIQCLVAISLFCYVSFLQQSNIWKFVLALFFAYLSAAMHSGMIAVLLSYFVVFFFYRPRTREVRITLVRLIVAFLLVVLLFSTGLLSGVMGRFNKLTTITDISQLSSVEANTDYIGMPSSNLMAVLQTPLRMFYFVLAPLPWHIRSLGTFIAFLLDGIIRFYVIKNIYSSYKVLKRTGSFQETLFITLLIVWFTTDLIFSWGTNNFGTAMRHRLKMFPIEIILMYVLSKSYMDDCEIVQEDSYEQFD